MPWREVSAMEERRAFVRLAMLKGENRRELCRRFGISPDVGYKWLAQAGGSCRSVWSWRSALAGCLRPRLRFFCASPKARAGVAGIRPTEPGLIAFQTIPGLLSKAKVGPGSDRTGLCLWLAHRPPSWRLLSL